MSLVFTGNIDDIIAKLLIVAGTYREGVTVAEVLGDAERLEV